MYRSKRNTPEYLSKDILDEDFMKIFGLITRIQMVMGSSRVHAKHRFVTPPTVYQKLYTMMCIIVIIAMYCATVKLYMSKFYEYSSVYYLALSATGLDLVAYICNIAHVRFFNNDSNTMFYVKLQNIDRLMKIDRNKFLNIILHKVNLYTTIILLTIILVLTTAYFIKGGFAFITFPCFFFSQLTFMFEMVSCSTLFLYFFIRMRYLNSIIDNHLNPKKVKETPKYVRNFRNKKVIRHIVAESHDFIQSETDVYLDEIFSGFKKFQEVYRFQSFIFCVKLVLLTLIMFEFTLFAIQKNLLKFMEIMFLATYSTFDFFTALFISFRCEMFFREIKETKRLCIGVIMLYQQGPLRAKAKKMLKTIEESPPCFSVFDMWNMDAYIFVKILSLVTSLIVTLLQFAFL